MPTEFLTQLVEAVLFIVVLALAALFFAAVLLAIFTILTLLAGLWSATFSAL